MSAVSSPLRNLRASSPTTFTTPRSGKRAAFIANESSVVPQAMVGRRSAQGPRIEGGRGLLARDAYGKFAVADARRESFRIIRGVRTAQCRDKLEQTLH